MNIKFRNAVSRVERRISREATGWRFASALIAAIPIVMLASAPALADEDSSPLETVTVTAQKRTENLQDVALSLTALTGKDLEAMGATGFRDWSEYVPNVTIYQGSSANRRAGPTSVIRGVSQTGGGQINEMSSNATTSYMIGQVPIFSSNPGIFDLERIEVLRGPQGTLFGLASMGGTIRFIPQPARLDEFAGEASLDVGTIQDGGNVYEVKAMVNIPLIEDKLAIRLAGVHRRNEGYIDIFRLPLDATNPGEIVVDGFEFDPRLRDGNDIFLDANTDEATGGRVSLKFDPTESFSIEAFAMYQKQDQGTKQVIDYNDQTGEWVASRFALEPQRDKFFIASVEASYDLGFGSIEYVGGYFDSSLSETLDTTTLVTTFLNGTGANASVHVLDMDGPGGLPRDPWPSATQFPFETSTDVVSNELRLQGTGQRLFGSSLTFDYVLGVFHMEENRHGTFRVANPTWNASRGSNTFPILTDGGLMTGQEGGGRYESKAVFADLDFALTSKLSVGAGLRYSESERSSALYGWGDVQTGRATNGATEGSDLSAPGVPSQVGEIRQYSVTPRYTAKYRFDEERMIFATVAKGVRMPSSFPNPTFWSNPGAPSNPVCQDLARSLGVYDDAVNGTTTDKVWSYDLGLKSTWLNRRLQLNTSLYYLDWDDLQRNVQMSQFNALCNINIPANVGAVEIKGFELEMVYVPIDSITLNLTLGYTDAQVAETVPGVNDSLGQPLEKGDSIENVAPWTGSLGFEYRFGLGAMDKLLDGKYDGFFRVDWRYMDERMGTNIGDKASLRADPIRSQFIAEPYDLTDVRFGAIGESWSGSLYVSNVFNDRAMYESFRYPHFPNQRWVSINQPRTVGVTIKKLF